MHFLAVQTAPRRWNVESALHFVCGVVRAKCGLNTVVFNSKKKGQKITAYNPEPFQLELPDSSITCTRLTSARHIFDKHTI